MVSVKVLAWKRGRPSTQQYLAMFSDKYVENNGKFYAVKNSQGNGAMTFSEDMTNGLYEVSALGIVHLFSSSDAYNKWLNLYDQFGDCDSCVRFKLLIATDNIGQIIAAPTKYGPFKSSGSIKPRTESMGIILLTVVNGHANALFGVMQKMVA